MKKILFFALLLFIASCSQKNSVPLPMSTVPTPSPILANDLEKEILEEIKQLPEITVKVVEQFPFKKMQMIASFGGIYNYDLSYGQNGKIETIKIDNSKDFIRIDYNVNQVIINRVSTVNKYESGSDSLVKIL